MPRQLLQIVSSLAILGVGVLALFWLRAQKTSPVRSIPQRDPPHVRTEAIGPSTNQLTIEAYGQVLPQVETTISAEVAGRIRTKAAETLSGRFVPAEATLFQIDRRSYAARVRELQALTKKIQFDLEANTLQKQHTLVLRDLASRELDIANKELARTRELAKSESVTAAEVDEKERNVVRSTIALTRQAQAYELFPTQRARLDAALDEAKAQLAAARFDVRRTQIQAPHAGVITEVAVEVGDFVEPGDPLLKVQNPAVMDVRTVLRDDQLYWIWDADRRPRDPDTKPGRFFEIAPIPVTVTFRVADRDYAWSGVLNRVEGGQLNVTTQTVAARVQVSQPQRTDADGPPALAKGMSVRVAIPITLTTTFIKIPSAAMQPDGRVYVVRSGKLQIERVQPIRFQQGHVLVRSESTKLQTGDKVVVSLLRSAFEGMEVQEGDEP